MKVLLSLYACHPRKGSEAGIGWHWALEIAKLGYETHVLTREFHRPAIEGAQKEGGLPATLRFHYYDLPPWQRFWERGERNVYLYYPLWQWGAAKLALELHRTFSFDLVHHLTFGTIRFPSFMGRLGVPFIFGPAGGGERAPKALRRGYPLRGKILDVVRDVSNALVKLDPLMRMTYRQADRILLRTPDSAAVIPRSVRFKVECMSDIGAHAISIGLRRNRTDRGLRLVYVGRLLYWKGMHIGLPAFARLLKVHPDARLTILGQGPEERCWRSLAHRLGVAHAVEWRGHVSRQEVQSILQTQDALLFPSLHDSGGLAVLEAAMHGLPIVCLNLGGPGFIVEPHFGFKIDVRDRSEDDVIKELSAALEELAGSHELLGRLSRSAAAWASTQVWATIVRQAYMPVELDCETSGGRPHIAPKLTATMTDCRHGGSE